MSDLHLEKPAWPGILVAHQRLPPGDDYAWILLSQYLHDDETSPLRIAP
jgi:hypothetical protein